MFDRSRKIAVKLTVLAGVPVIGALLLSAYITQEARERARSTEGIGSIEDLAELSARMTDTVAELQSERALASLVAGFDGADAAGLIAQEAKTDQAVGAMEHFLAQRDLSRLPRRLGDDLGRARAQLSGLAELRQKLVLPEASITDVLRYYGQTNDELISASAALTQLSNDGELLRALSALVATTQVKERSSREHAVLSNTFAHGGFAPGLYRDFVTLVTEERVYIESLKGLASDQDARLFERALHGAAAERTAPMRSKALEATEDDFGIDAKDWYEAQSQKIAGLSAAEHELARRARDIAKEKVVATQKALTYSRNLVLAVVAVSLLLAWIIGRGISKSVLSLARIAGRVQREKDFSLRAEKSSRDEVGALTDAFNEMLSGLQIRDRELEAHRENLEALVDERTRELRKRNEDMRLVLDTVDQGLVTLHRDGTMSRERSRAFDVFFGEPPMERLFHEHVAGRDSGLAVRMKFDWDQLTDGFLPLEVALGQTLSRVERDGMHYALSYKPLLDGDSVAGALLMVSNITGEIAAREAAAIQREQVRTIEHVLKDRAGFRVFFEEAQKLVTTIEKDEFSSRAEKLRAIHTLKGNAGLFDVSSVADVAHALEHALIEGEADHALELARALVEAWKSFVERIVPLLGEGRADRLELTRSEIEELRRAAKPYPRVDALVERLEHEPVRIQLVRAADQLQRLASRLGKARLEVHVEAEAVRVPGERLKGFWAAFVHVLRNVADHGLYAVDEPSKAAAGARPARNRVELKAREADGNLIVEVIDGGRGVDWDKVRTRAKALGLPCESRAELVRALFTAGLSTAKVISDTSGRGVGLSAVAEACQALGGKYELESELGCGARMIFTLPLGRSPTAPAAAGF